MKLLVVFSAFAAVACASYVPLAQPAHHAALLLDPHGRPLDTAEVINARAIHLQARALEPHGDAFVAHAVAPVAVASAVVAAPAVFAGPAVVAAPAAVSHQSRVDVRTSPAVITTHAAPVLAAHGAYAAPLSGYSSYGLAGHGHFLKKRSLGNLAYAPIIAHVAPGAISHQSRVDVVSSPAVVSHSITAPVVTHAVAAPVVAHAAVAPLVAHAVAPAAVSHQSRVEVRTSPALVSHSVVSAPIWSAPIYGAHSSLALSGHGHLLKKRSLGHVVAPIAFAHAPAVSHQSRVDFISRPAIVSQTVVAPVVAHAVPVAVAHAAAVPSLAHSAHFLHSAPLVHAAHW